MIDLRFDTVTRPSPAMREAVAAAEVGDDVIVSPESHAVWHETGGSAANAGVQFTPIGRTGVFTAAEFAAAVKPRGHVIYPPTTLVEIENTHNGARARHRDLSGRRPRLERRHRLLPRGSGALIEKCVRHRRMLGGAMRQVGLLAAAGIYAIDHNYARLAEDHANARLIAERSAAGPRVSLDMATVQTNIVVFHLGCDAPDAATVVARAKELGVLLFAFGARTVRLVTHLDVTRSQCAAAGDIVRRAIERD